MNVESSSASAVSSGTTNTQSSSQVQKNSSDKSFQDELKTVAKETETENQESSTEKETNKDQSKDDSVNNLVPSHKDVNSNNIGNSMGLTGEILNNGFDENGFVINNGLSLKDNVNAFLKNNSMMQINNFGHFQFKGIDSSLSSTRSVLDYSNVKMDEGDTKFFVDLVQNTDMSMQSVTSEIQKAAEMGNVQQVQKNANVSATLMNALSDAIKNNQPVRIDFDKNISVIIKIDKDGSITANFIPGDKAVEQYLKENMASLRQKFDSQDISYKELSYSQQQRQQQNQRRNNKENK